MNSPGPRAGGPTARRSVTPAQKLEYLAWYEAVIESDEGGAFLRREGLYSSQMTEWRRLSDASVLAGKKPGETIGARAFGHHGASDFFHGHPVGQHFLDVLPAFLERELPEADEISQILHASRSSSWPCRRPAS